MDKRAKVIVVLTLMLFLFASCEENSKQDITTVDIWHVYGAQTESPMNEMIELFNETVGKEENIKVKVTSIAVSKSMNQSVISSAYGDPGAAELPDMFVSYPKTVLAMPDNSILVDYQNYFSEEEIEEFTPALIKDGKINNRLLVLPIAESADVMFINKNAYDKFAEATGATYEDLEEWDSLYKVAIKYYEYTDNLTPNIPNDGKSMIAIDDPFHYFQIGLQSLEKPIQEDENIVNRPEFYTIWKEFAKSAVLGGIWLENGYATEPFHTGDVIVSIGTSPSILYFPKTVTYSDNTTEKLKIITKPVPKFPNSKRIIMERGTGICTVKSTPEKEEACMVFLKWLTESKNNIKLVTQLGYMPIKEDAYKDMLPDVIDSMDENRYRSLYETYLQMKQEDYFCIPPHFKDYLKMEKSFNENIRLLLKNEKKTYKGKKDLDEQSNLEIYERLEAILIGS